jgi:sulfide:quinone oxidoreductase
MRVVVLGAGFGGLELTTTLSEEFGNDVDVVLIDRADGFIFGFSKLDVMFGRATPDAVFHAYADFVKPGVQFVQAEITAIDPTAKRVETSAGAFEADFMVLALGADVDPEATPGLVEGGHEFYTAEAAVALRDVIASFEGGQVIVCATSLPYKCPPAPSETAVLMHDFLTERGLRDRSEIALVTPQPAPIPPAPEASAAILAAFAERGITFHPSMVVAWLDPARKVAVFEDGTEMPYDLFLGVPVHKAPKVVVDAGLTVDGWVPADLRTLETSFPGVFAIGDINGAGMPKAGVFAERQGAVAAARIAALIRAETGGPDYDGLGLCYLDLGSTGVGRINVEFVPGKGPVGRFDIPSPEAATDKAEFGASRVRRWFNKATS